ncbi:MAG: Sir2 family NAD-dependent protein deacetylase [Deltaproteobacteria bacterium]|nr:Sir2 family NAD-dependent protein deacetylase [Deltaproteobacteria bacterium]
MDNLVSKGTQMIEEARKMLVVTGAGLSTESGIPDFRSPGGVWDKYDPSELYFDRFLSSEKARVTYWQMSVEFYDTMKDAQPNRAHMAIKELEDRSKLLAIVTQNIDHLHHKAGNTPEKIIEIHGTAFTVSCLDCGKKYERDVIEERLKSGVKVPYCDDCGGILKPDTISFGQSMPEEKMALAFMHASECDLCIVMGSSLVVYPAASVPEEAVRNGSKLIIINRDTTSLDSQADLVIHDSVSRILGQMVGI